MNYKVKIFFYAENNLVMPMEELFSLHKDSMAYTYLERYIEEMKWQLFHGINKEIINPPEFMKNMCVLVEPVKEEYDSKAVEYMEKVIKKHLRHPKVMIRTKDGIKELNVR